MKTLFFGNLLAILFFFVHLLIWKIHLPRRQIKTLFILVIVMSFVAFPFLNGSKPSFLSTVIEWESLKALDYFHIYFYYYVISLMYIVFYGALYVDSPSLVMTLRVRETGNVGLPKDVLFKDLGDEVLVKPRLDDLVRDKQAIFSEGKYILTNKGRIFVSFFVFYRKLLKASMGG